jgi:hypothetical protein
VEADGSPQVIAAFQFFVAIRITTWKCFRIVLSTRAATFTADASQPRRQAGDIGGHDPARFRPADAQGLSISFNRSLPAAAIRPLVENSNGAVAGLRRTTWLPADVRILDAADWPGASR